MKIVIVGLGGIGSHLVRPLCRYMCETQEGELFVVLIDGDTFELRNESRQEFNEFGNKAEVLARELSGKYHQISITSKPWYVSEDNVYLAINNGDIVFSCVDNHATRKLLSDRCGELDDVALISGGNDYIDGNVQVFIRSNGEDITPSITHFHPEIDNPQDKNPSEMSCEELAQSGSPQLIFTNLLASAWMLTVFWNILKWQEEDYITPFRYSEIYFDCETGNARSVKRE